MNEDLKLDDNWALHVMIAIYFFFAVILMLNVLIGTAGNVVFRSLEFVVVSSFLTSSLTF